MLNPRENSYQPLFLRNYSSWAIFLSLTVKAMFVHSRMVSCESENIRTPGVPSRNRTLRLIRVVYGHHCWCQQKSRTDCCRNVYNNVDLICGTVLGSDRRSGSDWRSLSLNLNLSLSLTLSLTVILT